MIKIKDSFSITKEFHFDAAHRLHNLPYDSLCKSIHGHRYKILITIEVEKLNNESMVIDFTHLKRFQNYLDENFDHSIIISNMDTDLAKAINSIYDHQNRRHIFNYPMSTAENMSLHFCEKIEELLKCHFEEIFDYLLMIKVDVYETPKNCASYKKIFQKRLDSFDGIEEQKPNFDKIQFIEDRIKLIIRNTVDRDYNFKNRVKQICREFVSSKEYTSELASVIKNETKKTFSKISFNVKKLFKK